MKVAIRVDASPRIGGGHLARCLTLASELRARGAEVIFIVRDHADGWDARVSEAGFRLTRLPRPVHDGPVAEDDYAGWLGVEQERDAEETRVALAASPVDLLIVDHYALDATWEGRMRPVVGRIVVIDDLANRPHDADFLVDAGIRPYATRTYSQLVPKSCGLLLGPRYAPLDSAFRQARSKYDETRRAGQVLVFFGATDDYDLLRGTYEVLTDLPMLVSRVNFVVRDPIILQESLTSLDACRSEVNVYGLHSDFVRLMAQCSLAVGAGGVSMWERMCVGIPQVVVALAGNQSMSADLLGNIGAIVNIGYRDSGSAERLLEASATLLSDEGRAWGMRDIGRAIVDGFGTVRVVEALITARR